MSQTKGRFFESGKTMLAAYLFALILCLFSILIFGFMLKDDLQFIQPFVFGILVFFVLNGVYQAYVRRELTSMNILTGSLIAIYVVYYLFAFSGYLGEVIYQNVFVVEMVNYLVLFVLFVLLLINHVQINSAHKSLRSRVIFNKVLLIIVAAFQIYHVVYLFAAYTFDTDLAVLYSAAYVLQTVGTIFMFGMIVCIESRLNAYKLDREAATKEGTWTPEMKEAAKDKYFGKKEEDIEEEE